MHARGWFWPRTRGCRLVPFTLGTRRGALLPVLLLAAGASAHAQDTTQTTVSFGSRPIGSTTTSTLAQQTDPASSGAVKVLSVDLEPPNGPFQITSDACLGASVPPGQSCKLDVAFTPTQPGDFTATVTVTTDVDQTIFMLTGTGVATPPTIVCPPDQTLAAAAGQSSATVSVGTASPTPPGATVTGVRSDNQPLTAPYPIGVTTITWTAVNDGLTSPPCTQTITVQAGTNLSPLQLDVNELFIQATIGQTGSSTIPLIITNSGTTTVTIRSLTFGGEDSGEFSIQQVQEFDPQFNEVPAPAADGTGPLPPGFSRNVTLGFKPSIPGSRSANFTISSDAPGSPQTVRLVGVGQSPSTKQLFVSGGVAFGPVGLGRRSTDLVNGLSHDPTIDIHNSGTATVTIQKLQFGGDNPGDFFIARVQDSGPGFASTVPAPAADGTGPLPPGEDRLVQIGFAPTRLGLRSATLTVVSDAAGSPPAVSLSGTGVAPPGPSVFEAVGGPLVNFATTGDVMLFNDPGQCGAVLNCGVGGGGPATPGIVTQDAPPGSTVVTAPPCGAPLPIGTTVQTTTITDAAGNNLVLSHTITVLDVEPPQITCPAPVRMTAAAGQTSVTLDPGTATASDNCPTAGVTGTRLDGKALSAAYPLGVTTIRWTATDASGNQTSCDETVTIQAAGGGTPPSSGGGTPPPAAPSVSCPSARIATAASGQSSAAVTVGTATATGTDVTVMGVRNDGKTLTAPYPVGTTTITWTATDSAGQQASCTQKVIVQAAPITPVFPSIIIPPSQANPHIDSIVVSHGPAGQLAIIHGSGFADQQGTSFVTLGGHEIPVLDWTNDAIDVVIDPASYGQGDLPLDASYPVQVVTPASGKKSNTVDFRLTSG